MMKWLIASVANRLVRLRLSFIYLFIFFDDYCYSYLVGGSFEKSKSKDYSVLLHYYWKGNKNIYNMAAIPWLYLVNINECGTGGAMDCYCTPT